MILASEDNSPIPNLPVYRYFAVQTPGMGRNLFVPIYFKKSTQITLVPQRMTQTSSPFPYYASRSGQIIEPQLNRGSIRFPAQRSFVWIYFKESTRYHDSHLPAQYLVSLRGCTHPIAKHPVRKQSPGTTRPAISRIPPHHIFTTMTWTSSNRNGIVPRIFSESRRYHLSHLAIIFPHKNGLKSLFEPLFPSAEAASCRHRLCRRHESPTPTPRARFLDSQKEPTKVNSASLFFYSFIPSASQSPTFNPSTALRASL